jgi:anti-sigma regulatory factor (Ser/Thr protein kinase)
MLHTAELDCNEDPIAVRHARGFVATAMTKWGLADLADEAELLTSEVLTNAIVHAHTPVQLLVEVHSGSVVVAVKDASTTTTIAPESDEVAELADAAEADQGRGMVLVDALSDRWGWWEVEGGKVVWFALSAA